MKDQRSSIAARIAETITGGVRRRQREREPRAVVYDTAGEPRIVPPASEERAGLIDAAERVIELADDRGEPPPDPQA